MGQAIARGYKFALLVLATQAVLALGLLSDTLGIFVLLAMPLVALAWLPAGLMIWRENRLSDQPSAIGYFAGAACVLAGASCLYILAKWALLGLATK